MMAQLFVIRDAAALPHKVQPTLALWTPRRIAIAFPWREPGGLRWRLAKC
jgi:hypothetical protein